MAIGAVLCSAYIGIANPREKSAHLRAEEFLARNLIARGNTWRLWAVALIIIVRARRDVAIARLAALSRREMPRRNLHGNRPLIRGVGEVGGGDINFLANVR